MKMIEDKPIPIHLSTNQLEVLHLLMISPKPLKTIMVCRCLDKGSYFSTWRSLQALESNNLITRTGNFYTITKEGRLQYDKRTT